MKNKKQRSFEDSLQELKNFILSIKDTDESIGEFKFLTFFSWTEHGTIFLNDEESSQYRSNISSVWESAKSMNIMISLRHTERLIQQAILKSLDIKEKNKEKKIDERIEIALNELKESINEKPSHFFVFYPIKGLSAHGLPKKIGETKFTEFFGTEDENTFRELMEMQTQKNLLDVRFDELKKKGMAFCKVLIEAVDFEAALEEAREKIHNVLFLMNFYIDYASYKPSFLYLPNQIDFSSISVPYAEERTYSIGFYSIGQRFPFSFNSILGNMRSFFDSIVELYTKKRSMFEERILNSILWFGRATAEERKEKAFLLYAIALESLILDEKQQELQYRLSLRTAHVLGNNLKSRKEISDLVKRLYQLRSQIIHNGNYYVDDSELSGIKDITKRCIYKMLTESIYKKFSDIDCFSDWIESKMLN